MVGGAAALETTWIEAIEDVDMDDLHPESLWKFRVRGFGPLVVAGAYVNESAISELTELGVKDSKAISSDKRIFEIAKGIRVYDAMKRHRGADFGTATTLGDEGWTVVEELAAEIAQAAMQPDTV